VVLALLGLKRRSRFIARRPSQPAKATILEVLFSWAAVSELTGRCSTFVPQQRTLHAAPRITRYWKAAACREVKDFISSILHDNVRATASHAYRVCGSSQASSGRTV
jgi:hypothetical protein